ncbi:EpsG family protein [Carboxylicivirga sp. N1Y90]|uniref:EpsG family protein n=1 Tax=Carboxylicivirga fragile TaxID=3417571 RepID=UPI003D34BDCA|nr:EpsG family protein [Marinilabiliaceae bacterium N1Y90]
MLSKAIKYNTNSVATDNKYFLILFIVWPFLAFVFAILNYSRPIAKKIVYLFMVYIGLTFVVNIFADGAEYARRLVKFSYLPFSDFYQMIGGMYSSDTTVDIVQPLITFIVSRFTSHYSALFAVFAAVFSIAHVKSINLLYNRFKENMGWHTYLFMAFFVFILPVTAINGFRMWTAIWIFFYGAYYVILYKDARYLLITLSACLVHFSMISVNALLVIYYFAGNRNSIYFSLAVLSFILPSFMGPVFEVISQKLGGALETRYEMYSNEEYASGRRQTMQQAIWYVSFGRDIIFYYLSIAIMIVGYTYRNIEIKKEDKNLYSFLLLLISFVNFGKTIPSFGGRFQILFVLFGTLYMLMYYIKKPTGRVYPLALIGVFPMLIFAALQFRNAADCINAWIITPGFCLPLFVTEISLSDFLFN